MIKTVISLISVTFLLLSCQASAATESVVISPGTRLLPGCASTYGFSIHTGQPCAGKPASPARIVPGAGVYLGGWVGWNSPATTTIVSKVYFKRPLDIGSRGDDVRLLQSFLARDPELYPEGYVNGYFGMITARAVGRLQLKYGLVKSADETPYGFVGPATRALLNSLQ